jgi:hypothetical protein
MRGIWVAGLDHIRVGDRRKRQVAGIFDRRRRRIGNRNVGRKRRDIARRNARLGRGRLRNLLRIVKFFQGEILCRHAPLAALSSRSRMMNSVNAISPSGFRKKRPAVWNLESRGRVKWPSASPRVAFRGTTCHHGQTGKRLILLEPRANGIMGTPLHHDYEVRSDSVYFGDIQDLDIGKEMLDLASHIIETKKPVSIRRNSRITIRRPWSILFAQSALGGQWRLPICRDRAM